VLAPPVDPADVRGLALGNLLVDPATGVEQKIETE
jgi:hypothetical protein